MKSLLIKISFLFLSLFFFSGCGKNEGVDFDNPNVRVFVQQIKSDRYATKGPSGKIEMPKFQRSDIYTLLIYAKEHTPIRNYPVNPKTTESLEFYRLSQCLLWTIEKIRIGDYPSDTPLLLKIDAEGNYNIVTSADDMAEVWNLYHNWWSMVENQLEDTSIDIYKFDPLQGSVYLWD